jgi:putative peptidoglycan lipid II flippase
MRQPFVSQDEQGLEGVGSKTQALKHSAIVTGLSGLGTIAALFADIVIAARYGLGSETDALFVALTIPQIVASLLLVSFNVTLVPTFSSLKAKEEIGSLWHFSNNLVNINLAGLALVGVLGALCSPWIMSVIAPGLDPDTSQLAFKLSALLFLMIVPLGAVEVMKALLNALYSFGPPASANLLRNFAIVIVVLIGGHLWGIRAVVVGYIVGSWLQLPVMGFALYRKGYRYRPILNLRDPRVHETWRLLRFPLLGGAINLSNVLVERFLVSFLPSGTVSALAYARRILGASDTVFLGSVATAFLPRLSEHLAREDRVGYRRSLSLGLKLSLFIAVPMVAGVVALSLPAIRLLFQRGAFDQAATQATATYLSLYILGVPASAALQLLMGGLYADHDTVTPFYILIGLLAMTAVLDVGLFLFLGAKGLPLGLSLAKLVVSGITFFLVQRRVGQLDRDLGSFIVKTVFAALVMTAVLSIIHQIAERQAVISVLFATILELVVGVGAGVITYSLSAAALRIEEVRQVIRLAKHRLFGLQPIDVTRY